MNTPCTICSSRRIPLHPNGQCGNCFNRGIQRRDYAYETYLLFTMPWSLYIAGGRAMCSDGIVRRIERMSSTADTFYSVPASVRVGRKHVSGFITIETTAGFSTATNADPLAVKFVVRNLGKNAALLPVGAWRQRSVL